MLAGAQLFLRTRPRAAIGCAKLLHPDNQRCIHCGHEPSVDMSYSTTYDAIVIGSGAGGTAAAYRLVLGGLACRARSRKAGTCPPTAARSTSVASFMAASF